MTVDKPLFEYSGLLVNSLFCIVDEIVFPQYEYF